MAIEWSKTQRQAVAEILERCPPESGRCDEAAAGVLPIAHQRDPAAHTVRIEPAGDAIYLMPKAPLHGNWWHYHVTVHTERHYVDALTGCDGTPTEGYFEEHWKYSDPEAYQLTSQS